MMYGIQTFFFTDKSLKYFHLPPSDVYKLKYRAFISPEKKKTSDERSRLLTSPTAAFSFPSASRVMFLSIRDVVFHVRRQDGESFGKLETQREQF